VGGGGDMGEGKGGGIGGGIPGLGLPPGESDS